MMSRERWIALLTFISILTLAFTVSLLTTPRGLRHLEVVAALLAIFFASGTAALMMGLRRRALAGPASTPVAPAATDPALAGTVYGLVAGAEYRVVQSFSDYYKNDFTAGEALHFRTRHFLPYHGGHTIVFDERSLYLQESENAAILDHFQDYIAAPQTAS